MVLVQIAQANLMVLRVMARKARTAKHEIDVKSIEIVGNSLPKQLNGGVVAIGWMNTAASQLQEFSGTPWASGQWRQIKIRGGIKPTTPSSYILSLQAIGSPDCVIWWPLVIHNQ